MMDSLRNFLTGPRLFIVIAACALPFVFLGTSSLSSVFGGSLGTINGETVSELDFQVASNSTVQKFKNIYGNDFEFTDLDEEFQIEQIKQELIVQKVFLSEAKSLGLHDKNAEKEAKKSIIRNPIFQIDGVFSENIFEAQANSNGFTKESYIKMLTNMMASEMYRNSISSSGFSTSQEVKEITSLLEQTVGFDFIKIDRKSLLQSIENTNEEKLDFYNENEFLFYSKEKRSFKYIVLTPESYKDKVQIPEGYLESAYDEYLQRENSNTQTRFAHIMINKANHESNEKAFDFISNIKSRIDIGESFAELAASLSDDIVSKDSGGDLEYFDSDIFPKEFGVAIKDLEVNDVSQIVELDETLHILKVTEVNKSEVLSFDEMNQKLEDDLIESESVALMNDDFDMIDEFILNGDSIEFIGEQLSETIILNELSSIDTFDFLDGDEVIKDHIFSAESESRTPSIFDLGSSIVVVSLDMIEKPYLKDFNAVSLMLNEYLSAQKSDEKQELLLAEIIEAKKDGSIDSFMSAYNFISSDSFINVKRYSSLIPQDVISKVFLSSPGDSISMKSVNGDSYVLDINEFNEPSEDLVNELLEQYKTFSNERFTNKLSSIINDSIFDNANINLNDNVF